MATLSSLEEIVPSEYIERPLRQHNLPVPLGLAVADASPVPRGSGSSVAVPFPLADAVTAGTKAENADFSFTTTEMGEAIVTAGTVGYAEDISREVVGEALYGAVETVVANKVAHVRDRIESDLLGLFASASFQTGTTNVDLTEAIALEAMYAYKAQNPQVGPGPVMFVMTPTMLLNWTTDVGNNGGAWTQGMNESDRIAGLQGPIAGVEGSRFNMLIATSNNVPTSGGDGIGAIFRAGQLGPLLYRVWRTLQVESQYFNLKQAWELTVSLRYGVNLARQADIRGVLADN